MVRNDHDQQANVGLCVRHLQDRDRNSNCKASRAFQHSSTLSKCFLMTMVMMMMVAMVIEVFIIITTLTVFVTLFA
jgi:hypothetical protein